MGPIPQEIHKIRLPRSQVRGFHGEMSHLQPQLMMMMMMGDVVM